MRSRGRFAALSLMLCGLTACTSEDAAYTWLLRDQRNGPALSPAGTPPFTGTFSLAITDVNGADDFIFSGQPVDLYTIVLDINSPATGSLIQIREMSGDRIGRIVFRAVPAPDGNATGSWSIDPVTGAMRLALDYGTRSAIFDLTLTPGMIGVQQINRTLYLRTTAVPGTADPCAADTEAPSITLSANPSRLWPPNHEMVKVASGITATDNAGSASLAVSVTSNEPVDGLGDGDTSPDWNVVDAGNGTYDVFVRAERGGKGNGRVYTITASAADACENSATRTATVLVPKNQSK